MPTQEPAANTTTDDGVDNNQPRAPTEAPAETETATESTAPAGTKQKRMSIADVHQECAMLRGRVAILEESRSSLEERLASAMQTTSTLHAKVQRLCGDMES